ncbi:MAG: ParB/RepB/Spo0J family partition protein, partial [Eubacteriales bacterium]|nr:ParB/RepB/Spo0J family partition protein [Eubacteriales bacterium]
MKNFISEKREITYLPVAKIIPNPYQPRKIFNQNALVDLAESIKIYGVLEPICVRYIKGIYEVIAGERRLIASKRAGLLEIPCIITNITDKDSASIALIENIQRENLNFFEEAEGFQNLMVNFGYTQEDISKIVGKKQSTISNKMRLLRLPKDIKATILENNLSERHV